MENEEEENHINEQINNNNNEVYLKQENEVINYYNKKRNKIKKNYDIIYERFTQSHEFYRLFNNLIKDYKENIFKNIDNLKKILNTYFPNNDNNKETKNCQIDTIKKELKEIIKNQIKSEDEKINQLNFEKKMETIINNLNKSKELLINFDNLYKSYIKSIDDIQNKHLKYLKYFNNYEIILIDTIDKNLKNKNNNNSSKNNYYNKNEIITNENINNILNEIIMDENAQNELNQMTKKLLKKESKYKKLLKDFDENIQSKYLEFKKCIDNLSKYHNDFIEQENQIFTFVYLGYTISIEHQNDYQKRKLNFENLTSFDYKNYKELDQLFENINFENYNAVLISSNRNDNHLCKEIPSNIIIKLSQIINYYFPYIPKLKEGDYEEPNIRFIKILTAKFFEEEIISEEEENKIINILKYNKYRLEFLKSLNFFRTKGKFMLTKKNFITLGNVIRTITDLYDIKNGDIEVLNLLIIMCQTYYTINYKKKKIYLIRFIEDHKLFQSEELWKYYIEESINKEIKIKEKNQSEEDNEENEDIKKHKKYNLYFTILLSVTQNIMEFQVNKEIIKNIINDLISKKYNLTQMYIEQIESLIEGTVYEKKNKFNVNIDVLGKGSK